MGNIHHLAALSYNGPFQEPFLEKYRFNESALPESLKESAIVLPHKENYIYNGPKPTDSELLKQNIKDPENWAGGNFRYFLPKGESGAISRTRGSFMAGAVASLLVLLATIM